MKKEKSSSEMDLEQILDHSMAGLGRQVFFEVLLILALSVGCWYTFFSMFPNPVGTALSAVLITVLPILVYALCRNRFLGRFLAVYVFLFAAVFFAILYKQVWNGFLVMGNIIIEVMNDRMQTGWIQFELAGSPQNWAGDTLLAMIPVITIVSTGIAYSVCHKEPLPAVVLTGIPVLTGLVLKIPPSVWLLLLLVAAWAGLIALSAVKGPDYEIVNRTGRRRRGTIWLQTGEQISIPFILLGSVMAVLLLFVLVLSGDDYRPPDQINQIRADVVKAEEHLRYDRLFGSRTDGLTKGDLNVIEPLEYTEAEVMQINMQRAQAMHLRGFTGGNYSVGKWTESPEGAYSEEYLGVTEWLSQQGFYPWMQREHLYRMIGDEKLIQVDIKNVNTSSQLIYLPYEAAMSGDTLPDQVRYRRDFGAYAKGIRGQRDYSFVLFASDLTDYSQAGTESLLLSAQGSDEWQKYNDAERVYRKFVYDTYLLMDEKDAKRIEECGIGDCDGKTIEYTLFFIRKLFDSEYEYDPEAKSEMDGSDPLGVFLSKSHKGNDMCFATAAALMFRHAGIPARYVEGYYFSPDEAAAYEGMKDVQISVPDSWNHAWVEIYIDGLGWFPVEVVPGYYQLNKNNSTVMEEQQDRKETAQQPARKEVPLDEESEKATETNENNHVLPWLIAALLVLAIAVWIIAGRRRVRKRREAFAEGPSKETVFRIYRYTVKLFAFDGCRIKSNPRESIHSVQRKYTGNVADGFADFVCTAERVRFGKDSLALNEQLEMAAYAKNAAGQIAESQNRWRRFLMKFIFFYV